MTEGLASVACGGDNPGQPHHRAITARLTIPASAFAGALAAARASASTRSAEWRILASRHPDTDSTTGGGVAATLGPKGPPLANMGATQVDIGAATRELPWWTPRDRGAGRVVTNDPSCPTRIMLPFSQPSDPFPGGGGGNGGAGFTTAHLSGSFVAPTAGTITVNLGSDDGAWVFVNGTLVVEFGGLRGLAVAPTAVAGLAGGAVHTIDLLFSDRQTSQSGLAFSAVVAFVPDASPEPAPAALGLLGPGLVGLFVARRGAKA